MRPTRQLSFHRIFLPASTPTSHPMATPEQGKTGLRNSPLNHSVPTADPLLHVKQGLSLIVGYPTLKGQISLAPSGAGGQVFLEGHPSECLRWVIFQRCLWMPPNQSTYPGHGGNTSCCISHTNPPLIPTAAGVTGLLQSSRQSVYSTSNTHLSNPKNREGKFRGARIYLWLSSELNKT